MEKSVIGTACQEIAAMGEAGETSNIVNVRGGWGGGKKRAKTPPVLSTDWWESSKGLPVFCYATLLSSAMTLAHFLEET